MTSDGVDFDLADNTGTYYYLKDHLGSITDIVDSSGNNVQRYNYSAFGIMNRIIASDGSDITADPIIKTSYSFTGREYDFETGLYYYRARYMSAEIGRFMSEDPHPGDASNPRTVYNKYNYVNNSPTMLVDPKGEFAFLIGMGIAALAGGLHAAISGKNILKGMAIGAFIFSAAFALGPALGAAVGISAGTGGAIVGGALGGAIFEGSGYGSFLEGVTMGTSEKLLCLVLAHLAEERSML